MDGFDIGFFGRDAAGMIVHSSEFGYASTALFY